MGFWCAVVVFVRNLGTSGGKGRERNSRYKDLRIYTGEGTTVWTSVPDMPLFVLGLVKRGCLVLQVESLDSRVFSKYLEPSYSRTQCCSTDWRLQCTLKLQERP